MRRKDYNKILKDFEKFERLADKQLKKWVQISIDLKKVEID